MKIRERKKQDKRRPKSAPFLGENKLNYSDLRRTTLTIREVLQHHEGSDTFLRFCQSQYASENLLFWLHTEKYFMLMNKNSAADLDVKLSQKTIINQAYKIYNRFLKSNAPQWVCIDIETVKDIEEILEEYPGKVDHKLFTQAQEETLHTLEQDLMPRFVKDVVINRSFKASDDLVDSLDEKLLSNAPEPHKPGRISMNVLQSSNSNNCSNPRIVPATPVSNNINPATGTEKDSTLNLNNVRINVS